jgi:DNA-binding XRE family transcriptional regulator
LSGNPRVLVVPGLGDWIAGLLRRKARADGRRITKSQLAEAAGISRETLYRALSKDEVTPAVADSFARALGVSTQILLAPGSIALEASMSPPGVYRDGDGGSAATPSRTLPQRVRVWLAEFRAELTRAGATDDEIAEAMDLLQAPQLFVFYAGGKPREMTEEQMLTGVEALATVIRKELRKRGRKFA